MAPADTGPILRLLGPSATDAPASNPTFDIPAIPTLTQGAAGAFEFLTGPALLWDAGSIPGREVRFGLEASSFPVTLKINKEWLSNRGVFVPFFFTKSEAAPKVVDVGKDYLYIIDWPSISVTSISNVDVEYSSETAARITWSVSWWYSCTSNYSTWVSYGPTTSYGSTVFGTSSGLSYYADLSGLTADATYHYKVEGECEGGGDHYWGSTGDKVMNGVGVLLGADGTYSGTLGWQTTVNTAMESAANYFLRDFGIDFFLVSSNYVTWNCGCSSGVDIHAEDYVPDMQTALGWPSTDNGADVLMIWTNADLVGGGDDAVYGATEFGYYKNADAGVMEVQSTADHRRWTFQHEMSHVYGADDYNGIAETSIMDYADGTSTTTWDSTSSTAITNNRENVSDLDDDHDAVW